MELLFPRTFAPGNEFYGTFASGNESDMELLLPGMFVLWNFRSYSQSNVLSLPNTNYDYLIDKLIVLKPYGLLVSLYSLNVLKDGRF